MLDQLGEKGENIFSFLVFYLLREHNKGSIIDLNDIFLKIC